MNPAVPSLEFFNLFLLEVARGLGLLLVLVLFVLVLAVVDRGKTRSGGGGRLFLLSKWLVDVDSLVKLGDLAAAETRGGGPGGPGEGEVGEVSEVGKVEVGVGGEVGGLTLALLA